MKYTKIRNQIKLKSIKTNKNELIGKIIIN